MITNIATQGNGGGQREEDEDSNAWTYHSMVIDVRLKAGLRWLTNRDGGGILNPEDADTKTLCPVIDILREKHPNILIPNLEDEDWASFEEYDEYLDSVPVM